MVGGLLWWGPGTLGPPLNPELGTVELQFKCQTLKIKSMEKYELQNIKYQKINILNNIASVNIFCQTIAINWTNTCHILY